MKKVFFSWQTDISKNRNVIEKALKKAARSHGDIKIDTATRDTIGAIEIDNKILEKILKCDIFVADLSLIGKAGPKKRNTPNPNVIYETGFALGVHGEEKLYLIAQKERNGSDSFPFDLRNRHIAFYDLEQQGIHNLISKDLENFFIRRLQSTQPQEGSKTKITLKDDYLRWANWADLLPSFNVRVTLDNYSNEKPNFIEKAQLKGTAPDGQPWLSNYFKIGDQRINARFKVEPHDKVDVSIFLNQKGGGAVPSGRLPMPDLDRDTLKLEFELADGFTTSLGVKIAEDR